MLVAPGLYLGRSTVGRILKRAGLNRLACLDRPRLTNRREYPASGDLLHLDIKKPGCFRRPGHRVPGDRRNTTERSPGCEYVHITIDDRSRDAISRKRGAAAAAARSRKDPRQAEQAIEALLEIRPADVSPALRAAKKRGASIREKSDAGFERRNPAIASKLQNLKQIPLGHQINTAAIQRATNAA